MKTIINTLCITFFFLSFGKISFAQLEDHFHWFSGKINIPIIVDHQEVWESNNGDITETHIPDKQIYISFHMKAEDMRVSDNVFSGIIIRNHAALDEVITYRGKVSEDKQMMEYFEITKDDIQYLTGKREAIEKEVTLSARFENIPTWMGSYRFKYGVTEITSVEYNEEYYLPRIGRTTRYTESFVKIDEDKITKYTTNCIQASFKPGDAKISNKINKAVAIIDNDIETNKNYKMFMTGVNALMTAEFMKVPGLKVLERYKMEKLLEEIELSQTVLVNPKTAVRSGRIIPTDIEVLLTKENRIPENLDELFESFTIRSKIKIVETGQIIDANLIQNINLNSPQNLMQDLTSYIKEVVAFTMNFLYE